jgi:hypothetical protein
MKRIIIAGICLVAAAIVYGFADYLKTDKKQLQRMYSDEPAANATAPAPTAATPAAAASVTPVALPATAAADSALKRLIVARRHKVNLKQYSRAVVAEEMVKTASTPPAMVVPAIPVVAAPVIEPAKKTFVRLKKKTDEDEVFTKVSVSSFSRGSLRRKKPPVVVDSAAAVKQ